MNILFYRWYGITEPNVINNLKKLGHTVYEYDRKFNNYEVDASLMQELVFLKHEKKIDMFFSLDYYPFLSSTANVLEIPYISWIFDSPHFSLYSPGICYDTNFIFTFDKSEYIRLRQKGCSRVFHMPLAADTKEFTKVCENNLDEPVYDVSFVGSLYMETDYDRIEFTDKYFEGYLEGLMSAQHLLYGCSLIENVLSEENALKILKLARTPIPENYSIDPVMAAAYVLERKLSASERFSFLQKIGSKYDLYLFSGDKNNEINAKCMGKVDHDKKMPVVFNHSKINLNFTTRNIHSGVPLRVIEVLASGGFLITAYQPEIDELFENGKDLVMFSDENEMMDLIDYYLLHEDERKIIARDGKKKVAEQFTYKEKLSKMIEIAVTN